MHYDMGLVVHGLGINELLSGRPADIWARHGRRYWGFGISYDTANGFSTGSSGFLVLV